MNPLETLQNTNAFVYVRDNSMKNFTGFNFKHGPVYTKFWYSMVRDTPKIRTILQSAADKGKHLGVVFQLRDKQSGRVLFTTN